MCYRVKKRPQQMDLNQPSGSCKTSEEPLYFSQVPLKNRALKGNL